jgi:hypothetical protein
MRNGTPVTLETQPFCSNTSDFSIFVGEHGDQGVNRRAPWPVPKGPRRNPAYITIAVLEGLE